MASRWGAHLRCDCCGLTYQAMRTGDTFASIREEMRSGDPDPATWRYRRRGGVLGFWHAKKLRWWRYHVDQCADAQELAA